MKLITIAQLLLEFKSLISNGFIQVFVWMVIGDILTGMCKGWFIKDTSSSKGLLGLIKHLLIVCLVFVAYPYLNIMGFESIGIGFVMFYIAMYGISIVENLGQIGVPFPSWLKAHLRNLKEQNDKGRDENDVKRD